MMNIFSRKFNRVEICSLTIQVLLEMLQKEKIQLSKESVGMKREVNSC